MSKPRLVTSTVTKDVRVPQRLKGTSAVAKGYNELLASYKKLLAILESEGLVDVIKEDGEE